MENSESKGEDFFKSMRVAIIGLGLMGGSMALALHGRCRTLLGIDTNPDTLALAQQMALCDYLTADSAELLSEADLIVLATPVNVILKLLADLPHLTNGSPVVLDLGSTKARIADAMMALPDRFDPIGGHPMCGKECSSLAEADAGLYQGASFALTPLPRTNQRARQTAKALVELLGAHPVWLGEKLHDRWVASTSHAPFLIANALAAATPQEVAPLVGPGYRSTTRVSTTSPAMMLDVLTTNRENVLESLSRFKCQIDTIEMLLRAEDIKGLEAQLLSGAARQRQILDAVNG
jgi:prephenate dehydrogenase